MLVIPNLAETPFHQILVDLSMSNDTMESFNWSGFADNDGPYYARLPGAKETYLMFVGGVQSDPDEQFIRARLVLSDVEPPSQPCFAEQLFDFFPLPPFDWEWEQASLESIELSLDAFLHQTVNLVIKSSFSVRRDQLPRESLVASMIGLRTTAGEEQFLMSGAQFAVRGFPADTVSWYLMPGSGSQQVGGDLVRQCLEKLQSESIADAIQVLEARFNRIVRTESIARAHVAS